MDDEYVNKGKMFASTAWAIMVALLVAGWLVMLVAGERGWRFAAMLAFTACAAGTVAATLHIRCYMVRVMCLVRATSALGPVDGGDGLRPVRSL